MIAEDSGNEARSIQGAGASYDAIAAWYDAAVVAGQARHANTHRALVELAGDVRGQRICDLGCGQGVIARSLAARGASVVGIDVSSALLEIAGRYGAPLATTIEYVLDDAQQLATLGDSTFDGAVCNLALMDIPDLPATLQAVHRILRPSGWFVFSITHPCFQAPHSEWLELGGQLTRVIGDYNAEGFWRSSDPATVRGRVGALHRTISTYLNALVEAGFVIAAVQEPAENVEAGWSDLPLAILVRSRKSPF